MGQRSEREPMMAFPGTEAAVPLARARLLQLERVVGGPTVHDGDETGTAGINVQIVRKRCVGSV
jgi:hypothetical protein